MGAGGKPTAETRAEPSGKRADAPLRREGGGGLGSPECPFRAAVSADLGQKDGTGSSVHVAGPDASSGSCPEPTDPRLCS